MYIKLLISLFFVKAEAKIIISVTVGNSESELQVNHTGYDINVIDDKTVDLFKINTGNLKSAIKEQLGGKPNKVYLKSPTPWEDLYKRYEWEQVKRITTIESARLKTSDVKSFTVLSHDFENPSSYDIKINAGLSQAVENTVSTSWSKEKEVTFGQSFDYDLNVIFAKVSGTTEFSFTSSWAKTEEKSESVTIGTTSGFEMELKPGQAVTAELSASRRTLEIEVVYIITLRGNVAVNYKKSYKGHHFYFPSIESVLKSGGLPREVRVLETIKLGLYTDSSLRVYNKGSTIALL